MIRGNYSLAKEVRKNENKQKQKIQKRQKFAHQLDSLNSIDPIRLFFQIERLQKESNLNSQQVKRLAKLKEDWEFITRNKLHKEKLDPFLEKRQKQKEKLEKEAKKLHGKKSIYFNPELNPLGRVPNPERVTIDDGESYENLTMPIRRFHRYTPDPKLMELGVCLPSGTPPQFYSKVMNVVGEVSEGKKVDDEENMVGELEGKRVGVFSIPEKRHGDDNLEKSHRGKFPKLEEDLDSHNDDFSSD